MQSALRAPSLAPCRQCRGPVAGPVGLLQREMFHVARCPHCGVSNPHPQEHAEAEHAVRTALYGGIVMLASISLLLFAPVEQWL